MKLFKTSNGDYKLLPNSVWMFGVAKYLVETAISEIHCCVRCNLVLNLFYCLVPLVQLLLVC